LTTVRTLAVVRGLEGLHQTAFHEKMAAWSFDRSSVYARYIFAEVAPTRGTPLVGDERGVNDREAVDEHGVLLLAASSLAEALAELAVVPINLIYNVMRVLASAVCDDSKDTGTFDDVLRHRVRLRKPVRKEAVDVNFGIDQSDEGALEDDLACALPVSRGIPISRELEMSLVHRFDERCAEFRMLVRREDG
jgi:hypothetical protein